MEIAFTLLGDADLNHTVNGIDFGILAANFNKGVSRWDQGDFNYDNIVNGVDFGSLAANFNKGANAASDIAALDAFVAANGLLAGRPRTGDAGICSRSAQSRNANPKAAENRWLSLSYRSKFDGVSPQAFVPPLSNRGVGDAPPFSLPFQPDDSQRGLNITSYGAVATASDNTTAIQNAINAAFYAGGGIVEIPSAAQDWECGPITLANNIDLQIDAGSTLQMLPFGTYPLASGATSYANINEASPQNKKEISGSATKDGN